MYRSWRKQLGLLVVLAMTFVSLVPVVHAASAPNIVTYQGRVLNANGVPVSNASLSMIFQLYDDDDAGSCLWSNSSATCATTTARSVTLTTGLFTENLGDTSASYAAIPDSLFGDNATMYLQVTIAGEPLTPRRQITAAPYALNADTLDGIDSATLQLFETGSGRTFEDDAPVIIGTNAALTYGSGGVGDLRVEDELEVMGDGYIDNDLVVGASISSIETIANAAFTLGGDDLFVAGTVGVEGAIYTDGGFTAGSDTTLNSGSITTTGTTDIALTIAGGDLTFAQNTVIGDGGDVLSINSSDWDISTTGDLSGIGSITMDGNFSQSGGTSTFSTGTGGVSLNGATIAGSTFAVTEATTLNGGVTLGDAVTDSITFSGTIAGTSALSFDGSTDDLIETIFSISDPTVSDKTITVPNLSGTMILSGHTFTGDVTATLGASNTTALTVAADSIALATDTTGNYVATVADAGSGDITVAGSGFENAAITLDITDDALDFSEMEDTLDIDAATEINLGAGGLTVDLDSTGEFAIQDGASDVLRIEDVSGITTISDDLDVTLAGAENMALTTTTGSNAVDLLSITITNTDAGASVQRGLVISNDSSSSAITESLVSLDNADVAELTDGIIILASGGGVTDAIDATATSITNALNFGSNNLFGTTGDISMTNFDVTGATGSIITAGTLTVNGDSISADGALTIDAVATIQLGTDDDFLPQLGAGDAQIGASGTRWDSVYAVAGDFTGTATVNDLSCTDCIDFSELVDSMTLDAAWTVTGEATEVITFSRTSTAGTSENGVAIALTTAIQDGSDTVSAMDITVTNSGDHTGAANAVRGINIGNLTLADAQATETAIAIGNTWDAQLLFNDTTTIIDLLDTGSITWRETGGNNTLMTLTDSGSTGTLTISNITSQIATELDLTAANGSSSAGGAIDINAGTGDGAGNGGGVVTLNGGDGASVGIGGSGGGVSLTGGNANGTDPNDGGNVRLIGGNKTSTGTDGSIELDSGGSPTVLVLDGGDIGLTADDDVFINADDDFAFSVAAASAVINLFDNAFSKTIHIGGVDADAADTINIATNSTTADTVTIGNLSATTAVQIVGGSKWNISSTGRATFSFASSGSFALCHATNGGGTEEIADCSGGPTADYAEQYAVAAGVEYGDIVVPGSVDVVTTQGDTIKQLVKSSTPYQGPIVGIVSNNYGDFTSAGYNIATEDNPMPVALVGRVPVKVVSEGGGIFAGDYLTTSSTPGTAMKASKVGRVIGMALEDWDGVSATVMVQVNNSWSMGDVLGTDGTSTLVTDNVIVSSVGVASAEASSFDSYGLALRGSAWNGSEAQAVEMMLRNVVDDEDSYRLSVQNTTQTEVAYITNEGTMKIAGDMVIGGRLYPSDRGTPQTEKYIYYDGSAGPGGDFMRTNAKGWSTGSYDFAEMFPSGETLTSGDVVVFAGTGESVQRATGADGEQLAGIVSTRPGFLAGENVAGAYPIALAGRVPTKVSTENGSIVVGDPLTSSTASGVAMKATEAGQIIGYALESYTGSESDSLILAYVNVGYWSGGPQTITIVQNQASQASSDAQSFSALNMSGNIYMATNSILSIGRLEGVSGIWSIETDGTIKTKGSLKTVTQSYQGTDVETIAVTSPESVITLTGTSTLVEGRAEVRFEDVVPQYNDVISAIAPIRVIVTPSGPVSLYVSEKDQNHFVVERFVGSADVEFDWMVTGYRKGFEPEVEEATIEEEPSDLSVPSVLSDLSVTPDEEEPAAQEEPAPPESPDTTQVDSAIEDDGGQAAEPSDVVIEEPSATEP